MSPGDLVTANPQCLSDPGDYFFVWESLEPQLSRSTRSVDRLGQQDIALLLAESRELEKARILTPRGGVGWIMFRNLVVLP